MSDFNASFEGIGEMLNESWMEAEMLRRAEAGRGQAVLDSPVYLQGPHPGRYRDSFQVSSGKHGGQKKDRAWARLENTSPEALWVEVGSVNNPAHHVLARAMDVMSS